MMGGLVHAIRIEQVLEIGLLIRLSFLTDLHGLIRKINDLGMEFGLWVEPEMVNPDSDLYRAHPDWVYHFETRERTLIRNQLILNLARTDVRAIHI